MNEDADELNEEKDKDFDKFLKARPSVEEEKSHNFHSIVLVFMIFRLKP